MRNFGRWMATAAAVTAVVAGATGCAADGGEGGAAGDASPSAGASGPATPRPEVSPAPGDHEMAVIWEGVERTWTLHAPPGYQPGKPVSLVVALHGAPQSVESLRAISGLDAVADKKGFLVAYPLGVNNSFAAMSGGSADDVGFVKELVKKLVDGWSVDPARVYATGFSMGGDMSVKLAVEASDVFAAIAPVSGGYRGGKAISDSGYKPPRPVPMITFIGSADRNNSSIFSGLVRWQRNLNCTVGEPSWMDKTKKVAKAVSKCPDGSEVVDYTVNGMGHAWPSAGEQGFRASIDASLLMWDFFLAHPRKS